MMDSDTLLLLDRILGFVSRIVSATHRDELDEIERELDGLVFTIAQYMEATG